MLRKNKFGVVVIGRNEGVRLKNCLASVINEAVQIVYVDSGSTDDSVNVARDMGVSVVELDMSIPFTAARARNEGVSRLRELTPEIAYIQFVDGDCEVVEEWFDQAVNFLDRHTNVAVVCGRRRERFPEYSIYNLMCDIEWNTPIGEANACGGDAMIRVDAFIDIGGFRASLIAGEEPELCLRFRAEDWKVWRLDVEMSLHDAAMSKFSQWWKRTMRGGYAYAEGSYLHGASRERHHVRQSRSAWLWGLAIPMVVFLGIILFGPWGSVLILVYPLQVLRLALRDRLSSPAPWWRAFFLVLGKVPEMLGQMRFVYSRLQGKTSRLIEYK